VQASSIAPLLPAIQPARPNGDAANAGLLLAQIDAMQVELDNLREQVDSRRQNLEQVERELRLAARLQRDFLPKRLPNHARVKFNRLYRPAGHVSGDLYDVRRLDEQHVGVYIADAIGHGMPAALLAMFMHNALQTKRIALDGSYQLLPSHEAIRLLNEALFAQELAHTTFATAIYARVDIQTGQVDFARGGHPLPMLIRAGGEMREIGGEGALLGVLPDELFEPVSLKLEPGDRLILYTDGVEQLFVPPGEPADLNSWRRAIGERTHLTADELLADLWRHMEERGNPKDDVTIVTLEVPESLIDRSVSL
jgi:sigma-B regulation protein RsbU (phosphoserine phosphatase)